VSRLSPPSLGVPSLLALFLLVVGPVVARGASEARIGGQRSSTVECAGGPGGAGAGTIPPGSLGVGPLHMPGPGSKHSHWNPAARRFTSKFPAVITGGAAVTVTVPRRLARRVALAYGHSPLSREITFFPCAHRRGSFFAGGLVFARREPIALLVRRDGWAKPQLLRLGRFGR
jgi:hypothetical protein